MEIYPHLRILDNFFNQYFSDTLELGFTIPRIIHSPRNNFAAVFELLCSCANPVVGKVFISRDAPRSHKSIRLISVSIPVLFIFGYDSFYQMGKATTYVWWGDETYQPWFGESASSKSSGLLRYGEWKKFNYFLFNGAA